MHPESKIRKLRHDEYPTDSKRGYRAKSQTLARKRARQTKHALQGK